MFFYEHKILFVVDFKSLDLVSEIKIIIAYKTQNIEVIGNNLTITSFNKSELKIEGQIEEIKIIYEKD